MTKGFEAYLFYVSMQFSIKKINKKGEITRNTPQTLCNLGKKYSSDMVPVSFSQIERLILRVAKQSYVYGIKGISTPEE